MGTTAIEAKEGRYVLNGDVKGEPLNEVGKDFTVMKFANEQVDVLCSGNEGHKECIVTEGTNKILHLMLSKALHGTLTAAILWHETLTSTLIEDGFKLNLCDLCIANKMINGKQCAIACHVDDTKTSCMDKSVVEKVGEMLELILLNSKS